MKHKSSMGLFAGLALALASIYVLSVYFGLTWTAWKGFMFSTALLLAAMVILAALLVGIIKLFRKLYDRLKSTDQQDADNDLE